MQKAVEIESRGLTLRGMLHIPDCNSGKIPMVLIFHGYTGNKMEPHFIFVKLSRMLEKYGIGSVRFDFGGSGESDGDFSGMTISKELEDAKAILNFVKTLDFVNLEQIGALGLSMGGVVASMLAGECNKAVKALCLWAPALNIKDIVLKSDVEKTELYEKGVIDVGGLALGVGFIEDLKTLDILQKASLFDKKVLILHGKEDKTVPLNTSRKLLAIFSDKANLHVVEEGDHTFNNLKCEKEVLDYSVEFLKAELKSK